MGSSICRHRIFPNAAATDLGRIVIMQKKGRPAIDGMIASEHGVTRDGHPISYNRAPAPDLAPWIARLYATVVEAPADYRLECGLFNDTSIIRVQLKGHWTATTVDGVREHEKAALLFGPQTKLMPVSVTGSFISVGMSLRPGTGHALFKIKTVDLVDRLVPIQEIGLPAEAALQALEQSDDPEDWLQSLEQLSRQIVERAGKKLPDPLLAEFENICLTTPTMSVSEVARNLGVDKRRLERMVTRDFGMPPKQVLRRARALDMASHLRGVADDEEGDALALRYYDQSHLIHEFVELFGMSPSQFVEKPQPILTLALESRQARRLEAINRIGPGAKRPWERPD